MFDVNQQVKLEDAVGGRENPTINDMKNDEKGEAEKKS